MSLVGQKAPVFQATAVLEGNKIVQNFSLAQYLNKRYVVFFFYPADFTFVCPTEIIAFQDKIKEFEKREVVIVGCSVDSQFSHWKWLQTPQKEGGIQGVKFPLVADQAQTIAHQYDVLAGDYDLDDDGAEIFIGTPQSFRGLFLIDKKGVIRHLLINDMPLGRSVDEALRMIDALKHFEKYGEVCPANWHSGEKAMKATQKGVSDFLSKKSNKKK